MRLRLRMLLVLVASSIAALAFVGTGSAHFVADPCVQTDDPGHSEFGRHHVSAAARMGMLGAGGHKPGEHRGFASCDPAESRP